MGHVLNAFIWILSVRGHIPENRGFGDGPRHQASRTHSGKLMRALAIFVAVAAFLALALWVAVWLAIKLL